MNRHNVPIYLSIATVFGILIGVFISGADSGWHLNSNAKNESKIRKLMDYIDQNYVDTVNTTNLLDDAITQIVRRLDPHSVYIPKEKLQDVRDRMRGKFVGIGVQFRIINDSVTVVDPIKGGPSIKAGIQPGDRIILANRDTLSGKNLTINQVPFYLKGPVGTQVTLQVYRKATDSLFKLNIIRGDVAIKSVEVSYMMNDHIGYLKINRFARTTYREFLSSLTVLFNQGMESLVLDLRGNGGGFVDIAIDIVDEFLEDDTLIVFTRDNNGKIQEYFATNKGAFEKGKLYVLIDENSASASEIVAGALQDNDKGIIIGRRSFGKGLVQTEMDLGDGSALRLTTARYFTPTGRSIQKPYTKNGDENYFNDYQNRMVSGELLHKDSIKVVDSLRYETSKGKVVYGGGGIVPDVFVGLDTSAYLNNFYFKTLADFSFDYVDKNRKELTENWSLESYLTLFDKDDLIFQSYLSEIDQAMIPSPTIRKKIRTYLKASIARELFGDVGFYRIADKNDTMLQKVLALETGSE